MTRWLIGLAFLALLLAPAVDALVRPPVQPCYRASVPAGPVSSHREPTRVKC